MFHIRLGGRTSAESVSSFNGWIIDFFLWRSAFERRGFQCSVCGFCLELIKAGLVLLGELRATWILMNSWRVCIWVLRYLWVLVLLWIDFWWISKYLLVWAPTFWRILLLCIYCLCSVIWGVSGFRLFPLVYLFRGVVLMILVYFYWFYVLRGGCGCVHDVWRQTVSH